MAAFFQGGRSRGSSPGLTMTAASSRWATERCVYLLWSHSSALCTRAGWRDLLRILSVAVVPSMRRQWPSEANCMRSGRVAGVAVIPGGQEGALVETAWLWWHPPNLSARPTGSLRACGKKIDIASLVPAGSTFNRVEQAARTRWKSSMVSA